MKRRTFITALLAMLAAPFLALKKTFAAKEWARPRIVRAKRAFMVRLTATSNPCARGEVVTARVRNFEDAAVTPRRLVIDSNIACDFSLVSFKIDGVEQISSSEPIPCEAFVPGAALTEVWFDQCRAGGVLEVTACCEKRSARTSDLEHPLFRVAIFGYTYA